MFEPTERTNFLDLLRPPAGYRLESAVGTTYSLDFVTLTATLLCLIDVDGDSDGNDSQQIDTLHAITRLAGRVRVFVNRGQISGPSHVSKVTTLYDRIICEVSLAEGNFHPKVWVMHYRPRKVLGCEAVPGVVRVICTSRNLATSQLWEAFIAYEGKESKGKVESPLNRGLIAFLDRLLPADQDPSLYVDRLCDALSRTTFDLPKPMQAEGRFLWQWPGSDGLARHLPNKGHRALVVSPFIRKSFLQNLMSRFEKLILISRQQELDKIADEQFLSQLCAASNRVYVVEPADTEIDEGMDLHAKLLSFEEEHNTQTFLGSANASGSGWEGRNCEAVIKCSPGVAIDHFCDQFVFGEEPVKPGGRRPLRGWIREYKRQVYIEDEHDHTQRYLEEVCAALARLTLQAIYSEENRVLGVRMNTVSPQVASELGRWASDCEIGVALLSQLHSDAAFKPFGELLTGGLSFIYVGVADLTEFLVVDVAHRKHENHKRFIIKVAADFSEWRDQRDSALLQQLLTRDSLKAFLQAILFDAPMRPPSSSVEGTGPLNGGRSALALLSDLTVEDVLRSCTEDASRIEEISHLLKAFEHTQLIDEEFRRFWSTFIEAEAEARRTSTNG